MKPKCTVEDAWVALKKRQISQNKYAYKNVTALPELPNNTKVWFEQKMKDPWKQDIINKILYWGLQPLYYVIKGEDGDVLRRKILYPNRPDKYRGLELLKIVEDLYTVIAVILLKFINFSEILTNCHKFHFMLQSVNLAYREQESSVDKFLNLFATATIQRNNNKEKTVMFRHNGKTHLKLFST